MSIFLPLCIISIVICIISWYLAINSWKYDTLGEVLGACTFVSSFILIVTCISLGGVKYDNQSQFLQKQQDYIVLTQYIQSNKSDSILESKEMLNKIQDYNKFVINKQTDMNRPILKYWAEGANWNELQLIDLESIINKTEE